MCDVQNFGPEEIYGIVAQEASGAHTVSWPRIRALLPVPLPACGEARRYTGED